MDTSEDRRNFRNMKLLRSQAGFTITELLVVIIITGGLFAIAAAGFSTFFVKFEELSKTIELQRDAFNCLQTIKSGIKIGSGANLRFSGIATADSVQFVGLNASTSSRIILYPPTTDITHSNDYIQIYLEGEAVRYKYLDGSFQPPPGFIFPLQSRSKTFVTKLQFSKTNSSDAIIKVVTVLLEAKAEIGKDPLTGEAKWKYVSYTTRMAIAMK